MKKIMEYLWPFVTTKKHEELHDSYREVLTGNRVFAVKAEEVKNLVRKYEKHQIGVGKLMGKIRDIYFD